MKRGSRSRHNLKMYDWKKAQGLPDDWIPKHEFNKLMEIKRSAQLQKEEFDSATCAAAFDDCVLIKKDDKDLIRKYKIKE
jgi:hypothetical protein